MLTTDRVRLLGAAALLCLAATQAQAQKQIISAITAEIDEDGNEIDRVSTVDGKLVNYATGTASGRVLTDYGVNKVYAAAAGDREMTASSAWMDTFTAQGPAGAKVSINLSFSVDGLADFRGQTGDAAPEYGFKVYAMRGGGWAMNAHDDEAPGARYDKKLAGRGYDTLFLQRQRANGNFEQLNMATETRTMLNFANGGGQPGAFLSENSYDPGQDVFRLVSYNATGGFYQGGFYYKDFFRGGTPDAPTGQPIVYANSPLGNTLRNTRNALEANFSILDAASLCVEGVTCVERTWDPTTLTLDFEVMAGESFTLAAWMYADSVDQGATIDFFNTAKFSGLTARTADGEAVAVTSASNALVSLPGGGFGYKAATAVPEPAAWAMMILGLGTVGGALRRRRATVVYS